MSAASRLILAVVAAVFVSSCGRGSGGNVLPPPLGYSNQSLTPHAAGLAATIRIFVPSSKAGRDVAPELLHQHFVAASTRGALVTVYPRGSHTKPVASVVANLAANALDCKSIKTGRSCAIPVEIARPGDYDFVIDTYDKKPKNNGFPANAKQLAFGTVIVNLTANRAIKVVLEGVVASTRVSAVQTSFPVIDPLALSLTVEALDADGNAIVTDGYVDKKGTPVKLAMHADSAAGKTITFSPSSFEKPSAVTLLYAAKSISGRQAANGFSTLATAKASNGGTTTGVSLAFTAPQLQLYTTPTAGSAPGNIVTGPDGALWFAERNADQIGRITTTGQFQEFSATAAGDDPWAITKGPHGNLWFAGDTSNGTIDRITTSGQVTSFTIPTTNSYPLGITTGPDGNLWFTEYSSSKIGHVSTSGTGFVEYAVASGSEPEGITVGPDRALWFTECAGNAIGRITTNGSISTYSLPSDTKPYAIVTGSDGALWFADCSDFVGRMTTKGKLTEYTIPGDGEASDVALGPDGAIWFTVQTIPTETQSVGRVSTSGVMTLYPVPGTNPFPEGITTGPDGAIWFTELNASQVGRLQ